MTVEAFIMTSKGNVWALLPIFVFLILFVGVGVISGDFYTMPAVVGFMIALMVAFLQNRKITFAQKLSIMARSAGEENIIIMCLIFLLAGAFSGAVKAAGGADSAVNLGLSILPPQFAVVGLFIIACFISLSMGTSMGTIAALASIAVGISEKTNISLAICIGAVTCGAMFGDNLSMISDTTIAATRTQGCEMKDKFKENFLIVLPAAILTAIIFLALTWNSSFKLNEDLSYNIFQVIPYFVVLIGALVGLNVFVVLIAGTILAVITGLATGAMLPSEIFSSIGSGVSSMFEITVISILVAGIVGIVKANGGIDFLINLIRGSIRSKKGAELGVAGLISLVDIATANNTVAIVMAGPIAKEISTEFKLEPKRTASILDIFASVWQGIIPYGAQLLSAAQLTALTPFAIIPYLFYPFLMALSGIIAILFRKDKLSS
jgi:Na+/H+ antiporter NhaC